MDDEDLGWDEHSSDEFGERAAELFEYSFVPPHRSNRIDLSGTCPRCAHPMAYSWPLVVLKSFTDAPASDRGAAVESVTMYCKCARRHPGRDERDPSGCGAYWTLYVPRG